MFWSIFANRSISKVHDEWFADEETVRKSVGLLETPVVHFSNARDVRTSIISMHSWGWLCSACLILNVTVSLLLTFVCFITVIYIFFYFSSLLVGYVLNPFLMIRLPQLRVGIPFVGHAGQVHLPFSFEASLWYLCSIIEPKLDVLNFSLLFCFCFFFTITKQLEVPIMFPLLNVVSLLKIPVLICLFVWKCL